MARSKEPEQPAALEARPEILAEAALDPKNEADVAKAIAKLSPQEALYFLELLEKQVKRRRIQLFGYLTALFVLLVGTLGSFYVVGSAERGTFVAWVFLVPAALVALVLLIFGRWANRIR